MLQLTLADGKVVQRLFAGFIASEDDLAKFVAEAKKELAHHNKQNPILCELWDYATPVVKVRRRVPTEGEELTAAERR